jgi:hypothetical protein
MFNSHSTVPKDHVQTKNKLPTMLSRIQQSLINAGAQAVLKASDALHAICGAHDDDSSDFAPLLAATPKLGYRSTYISRPKTERTRRLRAKQDARWTKECAARENHTCGPHDQLYKQLNNMFQIDFPEPEYMYSGNPTWKQHDGVVYKQGPCRQVQIHSHPAQSHTAMIEYASEAEEGDEIQEPHSSELVAHENTHYGLVRTPSGSSSSSVRRRGAVRYSRNPLFYRQAISSYHGSRQEEAPLLGSEDDWILQYVSESDSDSDGEMAGIFEAL